VVLHAGVIEQVGSPLDLYHRPRDLFVAGFIGSPKMNFLHTSVLAGDGARATVGLPGGGAIEIPLEAGRLRQGDPVTLGFRPEHIGLSGDGHLRGEVLVVERLGGTSFLHVKVDGGLVTVQADGEDPVKMHDWIGLRLSPESCHLFDQAGLAIPRPARRPGGEGTPASPAGARGAST